MSNYWTEDEINIYVDFVIKTSVATKQHPYTVLSSTLELAQSYDFNITHLKELKEKVHTGLKLKASELPYIL